jgi:hypothetical protein
MSDASDAGKKKVKVFKKVLSELSAFKYKIRREY